MANPRAEQSDGTRWRFGHLDPNYGAPGFAFDEPGYRDHHQKLLQGYGYETVSFLAGGEGNLYDNQVWIIRRLDNGQHLAMKVSSLQYYKRQSFRATVTAMLKESDTLVKLNHNHIIQLIHVFGLSDPHSGFAYSFNCCVMELMSGTVESMLELYPYKCIPEPVCREWFGQIGSAVKYLHSGQSGHVICHLAIKPLNILYRVLDADQGINIFKLTDFEESISFPEGSQEYVYPAGQRYQRNAYSAPETRREAGRAHGKPTLPMDIYGLGLTLINALLGIDGPRHQRFWKYSEGELSLEYMNPIDADIFRPLHPRLPRLVNSMICEEPSRRLTIDQVLAHTWLKV